MKENTYYPSSFLGEITMKKLLFVLASAALLVFAFAAVAGAKYAGYFLDGSKASATAGASSTPGYLSWGGATTLMNNNGINSSNALSSSAHGGYITTTTKCAVCHSAHRATGGASAGTINNQFLTAGGSSCVQCHTAWGSTQARSLVEWANPESNAGPHTHVGSCSACHQGGIHGSGNSAYWGMNAFMLGGSNDAQIAAELPAQIARSSKGGMALISDGTAGNNTDWFVNGGTHVGGNGSMPSNFTRSPDLAYFAAQKSILTGYTCARSGCHINSAFANVTWGQTYSRAQTGDPANQFMTTGHSTAPGADNATGTGSDSAGCAPCHAGTVAGGYRYMGYNANNYYMVDGTDPNHSARAFGCDQCHDMIGTATNSTAFPHGNRAIQVYEWTGQPGATVDDITQTTKTVNSGNIWMYRGNQAAIEQGTDTPAAAGLPWADGTWGQTVGPGRSTKMVDPSITVIENSVGPNATGNPGTVVDGACLKCHLAFDAASVADARAKTGLPVNYLRVSGGHHGIWGAHPASGNAAYGASLSQINPYNGFDLSGTNPQPSGTAGARLLYLWK